MLAAYNKNNKEGLVLEEGSSSTGNAFFMAIGYAVQAFLSLMIGMGMVCFSRYLPTQIPSLNCCIRLYGGLIRFFMNIQIKLHYVTFIQLLMLWYSSIGGCEWNADFERAAQSGALAPTTQEGEAQATLLQLNGIMWILMHVIGGIIRSMLYIEPYYDLPDDADKPDWEVILCEKCGP